MCSLMLVWKQEDDADDDENADKRTDEQLSNDLLIKNVVNLTCSLHNCFEANHSIHSQLCVMNDEFECDAEKIV